MYPTPNFVPGPFVPPFFYGQQPVTNDIKIGTTSVKKGNNYSWTCFVEDSSFAVYSVTFKLHPTFTPSEITITDRPFEIRREGWGEFDIQVVVAWAEPRCPNTTFTCRLDLGQARAFETHPIPPSPVQNWLMQGVVQNPQQPHSLPEADCTVVSFRDWDNDLASKQAIGKQVVAGLSKTGFIYVTHHKLDKLINEAMKHATHFFANVVGRREKVRQLSAMRERMRSPPMKTMRGFSDMREEALNPTMGGDLKESFDFGLAVEGDLLCKTHVALRLAWPTGSATTLHLGVNKWPDEGQNEIAKPGFKDASMAYLEAGYTVAHKVLHAIALGLGLPEDSFDEYFKSPLVVNRYLKYPPQQSAMRSANEIGAGSHVDFGAVTLIYSSGPGLEILGAHEQWKRVKPNPSAFIVNTGYILEKLTNGAITATKHRVVNRENSTRISFALFLDPNPNVTLGPMKEFVDEKHPAKYDQCQSGHKGVLYKYN